MTKYDDEETKLRRCISLEEIKEEESWVASDEDHKLDDSEDELDEEWEREKRL